MGYVVCSCVISEAIKWVSGPGDRINVVLGINNTNVKLEWRWDLEDSTFRYILFERQRPGETKSTQFASRGDASGFFVFEFVDEYNAERPAILTLKNVDNNEEYIYTAYLSYLSPSSVVRRLINQVTVVVHGKK